MTVFRQNCAAPLTVGGRQFDVGYAGFLRDREEILNDFGGRSHCKAAIPTFDRVIISFFRFSNCHLNHQMCVHVG